MQVKDLNEQLNQSQKHFLEMKELNYQKTWELDDVSKAYNSLKEELETFKDETFIWEWERQELMTANDTLKRAYE